MKRSLFVISLFLLSVFSCEDSLENHPVPSYAVHLDLDLLTPRDKGIRIPPSYSIYTTENIIRGKEYIGFGSVIVVNTPFNGYKAFDLSCPYEAKRNILVEVDEDYNAVCPVCGSKFEILLNSSSGMCIEGKSMHPLRPYQVIQHSSNSLTVRNNHKLQ